MSDSQPAKHVEDDEKAREKVLEIARSMHVCMVTVADGTSALLSRPMTPQRVTDEGEVTFNDPIAGEYMTYDMGQFEAVYLSRGSHALIIG